MKRFALLLALALLLPGIAIAEDDDPFELERYLAPPEDIMAHSEELGLTEEQESYIKSQVREATTDFLDRQWDMGTEGKRLVRLLSAAELDEDAILDSVDALMELEAQVKRTHMVLVLRLHKILTPAQRDRLKALRGYGE